MLKYQKWQPWYCCGATMLYHDVIDLKLRWHEH